MAPRVRGAELILTSVFLSSGGGPQGGPGQEAGVGGVSLSSCRRGTSRLWGAAGVSLPGWAKARSSHPPTSTEGPLPLRSEPRAQTQSLTTHRTRGRPQHRHQPPCLPPPPPSTPAPGSPQLAWLPGAWARTLPTTGPLHLLAPFFQSLRSQLGGHLPRQIFLAKESPVPPSTSLSKLDFVKWQV